MLTGLIKRQLVNQVMAGAMGVASKRKMTWKVALSILVLLVRPSL